jgi:DNA polymerase-3 subunit delta
MPPGTSLRAGFGPAERFVSEVRARKLKPAYVLAGDEAFFRRQCRQAILDHLVPPELRQFSVYDFDLSETGLTEVLDRARTLSLMAQFQVFFVRGVKNLYGRGSHQAEFDAIRDYVEHPNPDAVVIFVADHISIPADARRMELTDRERYERIRETLGQYCPVVELARVEENDAVRWVVASAAAQGVKFAVDAARELVDALGGDMMLIANELEKLLLYAGEQKHVTLTDVETMVLAAKQRSVFELTDAISARDRARALEILQAMLATGAGEEAAIGHLYLLAKTFRQMLVVAEKNVRDARALWQALWPGFRVPPFAAEDLLHQARRYKSRRDFTRALRLIARADLDLRSSPPSKRLVLEKLILDLTAENRPQGPVFEQQRLPV